MTYRKNTFVKWTSQDAEGPFSHTYKVQSHKDGMITATNQYGNVVGIPDDEGTFRKTRTPKSWSNIKAAKPAPSTPKPIERVRNDSTGVTKMDQVLALLSAERPASRKAAIALVVEELGMTEAGASTYASNANKQQLQHMKWW